MKKAQFFTIIVVLLLSVYLFGFTYFVYEKYRTKAYNVQTRVDSLNWFISDLHQDMENVLYISGTRATVALMQDVLDNRDYIDNIGGSYESLILYGKLNGEDNRFMKDTTIMNWSNKVIELAEENNIFLKFSNYNIKAYQDDPWNVKLDINVLMYMHDKRNTSWWNQSITKTISVPIDNGVYEDPLYTIQSNGTVTRLIKSTTRDSFVDYTGNPPDPTDLKDFVKFKEYKHSDSAPNYLMRLQGNFSASACCGIESIVDILEIEEHEYFKRDRTHIDYLYWQKPSQSQTPGPGGFWYINYTSTTADYRIRLDNLSSHIAEYNATGIASDH